MKPGPSFDAVAEITETIHVLVMDNDGNLAYDLLELARFVRLCLPLGMNAEEIARLFAHAWRDYEVDTVDELFRLATRTN